jgi:hypothetical protein
MRTGSSPNFNSLSCCRINEAINNFKHCQNYFTSGSGFSFGNDLKSSIDADGGLGGEEDGVVSLAEFSVEDALQKAGPVAQSDEHQSLTLTTQAMDPTVDLASKTKNYNNLANLILNGKEYYLVIAYSKGCHYPNL